MANTVFIGIDPGQGGAVAIIDGDMITVFDTPLKIVEKTGKKDYDIAAMSDIFRPYLKRKVIACEEAVFSMSAQGVSSVFHFGRGKGLWEGILWAFQFEVHMIAPQTWKKSLEGLIQHKDPNKIKEPEPTSLKDKRALKKETDREKRLKKAAAKAKARELAAKMFPQLSDRFKTVNSDGRAEACLIANYAREIYGKK